MHLADKPLAIQPCAENISMVAHNSKHYIFRAGSRHGQHKHMAGVAFNPLNAKLNPICHLLALLGGATIVVVSRLRVKPYAFVTIK
jgi:hypothetical protein